MNNSPLDARLLQVFSALMSEQSVTRAARRLGLTQPAISNALRRLREILGDDLFRRSGDGMRPTPRALELANPVSHVLRQLEGVLQPMTFVPGESNRAFRLAVSPPISYFLIPRLALRLHESAPGITLTVQSAPSTIAAMLLDSQAADAIISVVPNPPKRAAVRPLYRENYVGLMRAGHPLAQGSLSLAKFVNADHILVTQTQQTTNLFDDAIAKRGLQRTIKLIVTDLTVAANIISNSDLVSPTFSRTAQALMKSFRGRLVAVPLRLDPFAVTMMWDEKFSRHPAYSWFQNLIVESAGP